MRSRSMNWSSSAVGGRPRTRTQTKSMSTPYRPIGTLTAIDPKTGDIVATVELEDTAPEGAAADGKGPIFVNNEGKNTIQVIDVKTWKATASWPLAPCQGTPG